MTPEPVLLICALADAAVVVPGSSFEHVCAECGRRVMVAPSGQKVLKQFSSMPTISCMDCAPVDWLRQPLEFIGTVEEIASEVHNARPNKWRERN